MKANFRIMLGQALHTIYVEAIAGETDIANVEDVMTSELVRNAVKMAASREVSNGKSLPDTVEAVEERLMKMVKKLTPEAVAKVIAFHRMSGG